MSKITGSFIHLHTKNIVIRKKYENLTKLLDKLYSGLNRKTLWGLKDFDVFRLLRIYAVSQRGTECRHFV